MSASLFWVEAPIAASALWDASPLCVVYADMSFSFCTRSVVYLLPAA